MNLILLIILLDKYINYYDIKKLVKKFLEFNSFM